MSSFLRIVVVCIFFVLLSFSILLNVSTGYYAHATAPPACAYPPSSVNNVTATPVPPQATSGIILINELLTNPAHGWDCASTTIRNPWFELYNPQNQLFDLYAAHALLESSPDTYEYPLPQGSIIPAHGFITVFPTGYAYTSGTLCLLLNGIVIDQVTFPTLATDQSYAREQDGSANWQIVNQPTINASNNIIPATPTLSPSPTLRTSPTHTTSSNTGKKNASTSGGTSSQTQAQEPPTLGTQPAWIALQLPSDASPPPSIEGSNVPATANPNESTPTNDDSAKKVLLSALVVLLGLVLLWCWKLFQRKRPHSSI